MKRTLLTLLTILPLGNISVASSIKLNELDQDQKSQLISELLERANPSTIELIEDRAQVTTIDEAINILLNDQNVINSLESKKEAGSGSGAM
jgi:hypothetical protein